MASRPSRPRAPLIACRIADSRHPIFDGTGAALIGGRWNSPGHPVIYAASSFAGAMLECLVHAGTGRLPINHKAVIITCPPRVAYEERSSKRLPQGWDHDDNVASRAVGDGWLNERRTAVLIVPSVVANYEKNLVINPLHPHFKWIRVSPPQPVVWDTRLFNS